MQTFDTLSQLFSPTPIGPPDIAPLIPPPAVKPAVVMVKPRINPQGKNPAEAGDAGPPASSVYGSEPLSGGGIKSVPRLGPVAASTREASDAGKKKLFDNSGYWQDVAAGIQSVPGNAGPISAFANGFAGAISGGAKRKKDEAATAAATKQQAFENGLKTNAEGRANDASARDDKRLAIEQETAAEKRLLDKDGNLTAAGIGQVEKYADDYATSLGLKGSTLIADERTAAEAKLEAYRKELEARIIATGKPPTPQDKQAAMAAAIASGGPLPPEMTRTMDPVAGSMRTPAAAAPGAVAAPQPPATIPGATPPRIVGLTPPAQAAAQPQTAAIKTTLTGSGTSQDPYRGDLKDGDPAARAAIESLPIGAYVEITDATGAKSVFRRK
jgi:hypothetical protein